MAQFPLFFLPSWAPLYSPFVSPSAYLAPSSCDRNRPPQSQVACKLTPFAPPFTQLPLSLQIPRTPTAQRLTKTTSGIFRLLLSGTIGNKDDSDDIRGADWSPAMCYVYALLNPLNSYLRCGPIEKAPYLKVNTQPIKSS